MTDYPYEAQLIADPATFQRAVKASVTVYDASDTSNSTPLALKDVNGLPLTNPQVSNSDAFIVPFLAPAQDVKLVGAGFTIFLSSAKGMRDAAAASALAAQASASQAALAATAPTDAAVDVSVAKKLPPAISQVLASDPTVVSSAANMAQSTAGLVPVWKATTAYAAGQKVISPNGDVVAAKIAFTSGTTYSAANWNASTQDGRIGNIEVNAVFGGDQRLVGTDAIEGILFGIVDKDDKQTALTLGLDGDLTPYAAGRVGKSVGLTDPTLDSGQQFAVVDAEDRIIFAPRPAHPSSDWAHWGDSLTDNAVTGVDAWVNQLSSLTGRNHFNGGWYQQTSAQIAARQGGLPALVTVANNATASSGGTVVTSIINSPVLYSKTRYVRGTLAGIPGSLQQYYSNSVLFYPDDPGVFQIPPKSPFVPANALANRDRHLTIWTGRNDVYSTDPQLVVAAIQQMIDYVSSDVKRVLVFEVPPSTADGSSGKPLTKAINDAIKAAFPASWLPIASWLRTTDAATAAGITFTAQDNADIANGDTPSSFRLDSVHINATGCKAVAFRVNQEAQKRGWL